MKQGFLFISFYFLFVVFASGQESEYNTPGTLTHWLTPGEKLRLNEIGRGFIETAPPDGPVRNIAEFNRVLGALVRYPLGVPISLIKEMAEDITVTTIVASTSQKNTVTQQYVTNGVDTSHCDFLIAPTDSYWTRDYGPWFVSYAPDSIAIVDFPYNRPRPNDDAVPVKVAQALGIRWFGMNLIHTGGNYMTDGTGNSSSTELVWEENPSLSHSQVADKVHDYLGIETYQVRPDPNGTYIDHIDCWGKFLAQDKILIRKVPATHPQYSQIEAAAEFWTTQICPYGYPYKVFRVMTPNNQPYSNSVILNNKVLIPFMNSSWDDSAKAVYQAAMPGYEIIGFLGNPGTPWESTDALHCRVMGIADIGMLYINHIPLSGNQPCESDYMINADLIVCSHQPVITDSVLIYYSVNNGPYHIVFMDNTAGNHYTGLIPKQPGGSIIRYYLFAADESGRRETCPLIGPGDPFQFNTVYTDITAIPDTIWFNTADEAMNGRNLTIHNYTGSEKTIVDVESSGMYWWIDPWPVVTLPYNVDPGDSLELTIHAPVVVKNGMTTYFKDTMNIVSALGIHQVIIMINSDLLNGKQDLSGKENLEYLSNQPNPFTGRTTIFYQLPRSSDVSLEIYDWSGNRVKSIRVSGNSASGSVEWTGLDEDEMALPGGMYFLKVSNGKQRLMRKMVLIR